MLWVNLSIFIFGAILLEGLAGMYYGVRSYFWGRDSITEWVNRIPADAYADRSWLLTGFHEGYGISTQWVPFVYWRRKEFSGEYVNVDARGLRHTWNAQSSDPIRIYMFGGSTMWGTASRDDYTIPSCLSKLLAQEFPSRIEVTNYGESGYVSTQEMILLLRELQSGHRPQIVVFYDGYNDTYSAFQTGTAGVASNEFHRIEEYNLLNQARRRDLLREALKLSKLYELMQGVRNKLVGEPVVPPPAPELQKRLIADVFQVYLSNATTIEAVGEKNGFVPLFYWQPTAYTRDQKLSYEQSWISDPGPAHFFTAMYAALKSSPITRPSFHDITGVLDGQEGTLYVDFAHTTERANEIIARRIYQDVAPLVRRILAQQSTAESLRH